MLDKVKEFFDQEYKETKDLLERKPSWCKPKEAVYNSIQRCLGLLNSCKVSELNTRT